MTRHFLALIALMSGLLALQSPAQASLVDALSSDTDVSVGAMQASQSDACPCQSQERKSQSGCADADPQPDAKRLPPVLRLPVLMGVERAYE